MKKLLQYSLMLLIFMMLTSVKVQAQTTTVYLVRHAEKVTTDPANRNPELTEEGKQRAAALQDLLKKENIAAIFSTDYHRTRQTAAPLSELLKLPILSYNPANQAQLAETITKDYKGKTILIVGHSNSILESVEALGGQRPLPQIPETDYDNLVKLTIRENGEVETTLSNYGKKTD